ncbi:MAG: transposase [Cytophagaceae bacterium]|nr:transposase [Cytophagaceae bacterium]
MAPHCEVINYVLMPNHFHFTLFVDERVLKQVKVGNVVQSVLSAGVQRWLSGHAKGINVQQNRTGSLFTQNTRAKLLAGPEYLRTCFHYLHQNPWKANLVSLMEQWPYSSFSDYAGLRAGSLSNQVLARQLVEINFDRFYQESYESINPDLLRGIW